MREELSILKYPRTPHLEGSRLQPGDEDLSQIRFSEIAGRHLVVEEKCDGANAAISFSDEGEMFLQSRGHYLTGGYRERHFNLMKQWASVHRDAFYQVLGSRYLMYGEWMYAKHTVFYDALPHYFLEFDIYDRAQGIFLDKPVRCRYNSAAGAEIFLHQQNLRPRMVLAKGKHCLGISRTESVNTLVLIPYHKQIVPFSGQEPDNFVLDFRGILGFVHANVGISVLKIL